KDWFEQWLGGFTDGDGSFIIIKAGSYWKLSFEIGQSNRNLRILNYIKTNIGCGRIYPHSGAGRSNFIIRDRRLLKELVLPIFDRYPLLTSKYYDFVKFKKAIFILEDSTLSQSEKDALLEELRSKPRDADVSSPVWKGISFPFASVEDVKSVVSLPWLVGFVEAEGSFYLREENHPEGERHRHGFHICQKGNKIVIEAIRSFLHITTRVFHRKERNLYEINTSHSRSLVNIVHFFNSTFKGMKSLEFRIWARSIKYKANKVKLAKAAHILAKIRAK